MTTLRTASIARLAHDVHEHAWDIESRHPTSEGTVLYVICAECGARRVDLHPYAQMPPFALSLPTR